MRPRVLDRRYLPIDLALLACLAIVALQLVPLPPDLRLMLSPSTAGIDRALLLTPESGSAGARPLSIDPASTLWALVVGGAMALVFWCARTAFERHGGLRTMARGLAGIGLTLAVVMLVQKALAPRLIYGLIAPTSRTTSPAPHGPFVNRNDFAMWVAMALPVVVGYILARVESRRRSGAATVNLEAALDDRMVWLIVSAALLTASLVASLSRGGLMGIAAAVLVMVALARRRLKPSQVGWLAASLIALIGVGAMYANMPALADRLGATLPSGLGGRLTLWREAWPMVPDFLLTGVGAGAFQRGMLVYQESTRLIFFNHAHNEYLQILIEGGVLLAVPAAVVLVAGLWKVRRRLREDPTAVFWIRAGAAAGLIAAAVQSVVDTGLRMPANGVLFAILAAAALHDSDARQV
jgi:O-antigen ligase